MKKKEADFGILFRHWIKANPQYSSAYELKQTTKDNIAFSCLEDNQINWLQAIKSQKGAFIRIQGTNGEPDYIYLRNVKSWIVIKYPQVFYIINISDFLREKKKSNRKSLTSERAREISTIAIDL